METTQPTDESSQISRRATTSLVLSIVSFFMLWFGPLASIPAIILGHVSHRKILMANGALEGKKRATAGLVLGYVNLAFAFSLFLFPATCNTEFQGRLTSIMNNGRNIYVAIL